MTDDIAKAVFEGDRYDIAEVVQARLDAGEAPMVCLEAMMAGLDETGKKFECGEYYVPELMMAADTFKAGLAVLAPRLSDAARRYRGTIVLGTVQGDVHDIGKNLVGFMLESGGFRVIDLGTNVSADRFVEAVSAHSADVLAMSALLTTTMLGMRTVMEALEQAGLRSRLKVIVGGAPVSQRFAEEIRADAYGANGPQGVDIVRRWLDRSDG